MYRYMALMTTKHQPERYNLSRDTSSGRIRFSATMLQAQAACHELIDDIPSVAAGCGYRHLHGGSGGVRLGRYHRKADRATATSASGIGISESEDGRHYSFPLLRHQVLARLDPMELTYTHFRAFEIHVSWSQSHLRRPSSMRQLISVTSHPSSLCSGRPSNVGNGAHIREGIVALYLQV